FLTREGLANTANLVGQFTVAPFTPALVVTKSGPTVTSLAPQYSVDVLNIGNGDAWNVTLRDLLPRTPAGGTCDTAPQIMSAQVFANNGITPVPGKGPLQSTDYATSYIGPPTCRFEMTMLTPAGTIGPNERLIIQYRSPLDANTQDGAVLTNIVGA